MSRGWVTGDLRVPTLMPVELQSPTNMPDRGSLWDTYTASLQYDLVDLDGEE